MCYFSLVDADQSARMIQLLSYLERGSMYSQLKKLHQGQWMAICKNELNVCSRTVNRYVGFYELAAVYPRIIVCDIAFDTIMYCKHEIVAELSVDYELGIRFQTPLRDVNLYVDMEVDGATLPKLGDDEEDLLLADNNINDWNAGWDVSDSAVCEKNDE